MRKIITLLLAGSLVIGSLAGCGGAGGSSSETTGETSSSKTGTFYIGGIGPTTGAAAIYGIGAKNGAQIAVDEINEAGGVGGYPIAFNFQDDQHDAEKSVNAYNTLKDWGMQMLVGTITTNPCIAVADRSAQDNIFQLTPSASSTDVIAGDNVFQVCFTDPNQGTASARYIDENHLAEKIGIIYDSSDVYSSGIEEKFIEEAESRGLSIVSKEAFTADSKTDFSTQLQKAQSAGAELIYLPIYYQEASIILKQADTMGYDPVFFGVDGMDGILGVENFDLSLAEGVILLTPFAADSEEEATASFVAKYEEQFGEVPNQFAADGYDSIYTLKAALEQCGATPDMSASDLCEALKTAITEITVYGITGDADGLTWDAGGEVSKAPKAVVIENGAYAAMD